MYENKLMNYIGIETLVIILGYIGLLEINQI